MCPEIEKIIASTEADPPIAIDLFLFLQIQKKIESYNEKSPNTTK